MTSVRVAEHGRCCPNAIIDCCTREIVASQLELGSRADEAIAVVARAAPPRPPTPSRRPRPAPASNTAPAPPARRFKQKPAELGIRHRRGGYRDPERQALTRTGSGNPNNGSYGRTSTRRSTTHDPA